MDGQTIENGPFGEVKANSIILHNVVSTRVWSARQSVKMQDNTPCSWQWSTKIAGQDPDAPQNEIDVQAMKVSHIGKEACKSSM
jgi:hypothetical protein